MMVFEEVLAMGLIRNAHAGFFLEPLQTQEITFFLR